MFHLVGGLSVDTPTAGTNWPVSPKDRVITYTTTGTITSVKLYYAADGTSFSLITTKTHTAPGTYTHTWTDMPDTVTNSAKVKVTDGNNESVVFATSGTFSLIGALDLTAPESGAVVTAESAYLIQWDKGTAIGIANAKLELSTDGGTTWAPIQEAEGTANDGIVPNSGSYSWTAPATLTASLKLRVSDPANSASLNTGAGLSELRGQLTVTDPNDGAESWDVGSLYPITWSKKGNWAGAGYTVRLLYSADDGATWTTLTGATGLAAASGSWDWAITESIPTSAQARIRVQGDPPYTTV